ncbi:hypothetical protein EDD85DRAFT_806579 [Armillaria nabsnona]|nr:hypothetical protein EDD85DRAFT_806579 [Armillaria nabsnona]
MRSPSRTGPQSLLGKSSGRGVCEESGFMTGMGNDELEAFKRSRVVRVAAVEEDLETPNWLRSLVRAPAKISPLREYRGPTPVFSHFFCCFFLLGHGLVCCLLRNTLRCFFYFCHCEIVSTRVLDNFTVINYFLFEDNIFVKILQVTPSRLVERIEVFYQLSVVVTDLECFPSWHLFLTIWYSSPAIIRAPSRR